MSLQESMSVLLKPSIQKTYTLYLLFSFPFKLFVNKNLRYHGDGTFWAFSASVLLSGIIFFFKFEFFFFKITMKTHVLQLAKLVIISALKNTKEIN